MIGAVIVTYRSDEETALCVASLLNESIDEIVIVDNELNVDEASLPKALGDNLGKVRIVRPGRNLGYGSGINRGSRELTPTCKYLLVCNPDISVLPGCMVSLLDTFKDKRVAVAAPKIISPDSTIYPSARQFPDPITAGMHSVLGLVWPSNPFSKKYRMEDMTLTQENRSVDWVSGACFLIDIDIFNQLGGFDEDYFMYVEDVDLCWRIKSIDRKVVYCPKALVQHAQGVSTKTSPLAMEVAHWRSALLFSRKTMKGLRRPLVVPAVIFLTFRLVVALTKRASMRVVPLTKRAIGRLGQLVVAFTKRAIGRLGQPT